MEMISRRNFLKATAVIGGAAALTACGGDTTESTDAPAVEGGDSVATEGGKKVGICIYKFDDNFMSSYRASLDEILKGKGYETSIVDGNNDQAKQTEQIQTFITQGVDALIVNPVMPSAVATTVAAVKDANIPTVLINREPTADDMAPYDRLVYVGCDAAQSGTMQGELILATANKGDINGDGKVSYIMIQGDPENVDAQLRTEYSVKALTDAGIEVEQLDLQRGDWDQVRGQEICAADLSQYGDKIEVVFCNNDSMAMGAMQAIQAAGRVVGENIYLVGVDALPEALTAVKEGTLTGTVLNDAVGQAEMAVECMEALMSGTTYAAGEQSVYVDYVAVSQDNVADFM